MEEKSNKHKHERKIVPLWDVFGVEKPKHDNDVVSSKNQVNQGGREENIMQSSNSDIIFGKVGASLHDLKKQRRENHKLTLSKMPGKGTLKRQAPPPPKFLVDVDVGFAEQGLGAVEDAQAGPGPPVGQADSHTHTQQLATHESGHDTHPGSTGHTDRKQSSSNTTQAGQPGRIHAEKKDQPPNQHAQADIPSPPPRSNRKARDNKNVGVTDDTTAMTSQTKHTGYTKNTNNKRSSKTNHTTVVSLDQSSSGVETDDNTPTEGSIQWPPKIQSSKSSSISSSSSKLDKNLTNGYHSEQEYGDSDDDLDTFGEDEATLEFGEEEDVPVEGRHKQVYTEYQGEDYAKYLNEETDNPKYKKKQRRRRGVKPPPSPISGASVSSGENNAKKGLKVRLGNMFGGQGDARRVNASSNNIHNFTFADSKIGNTIADGDIDDSMFGKKFEKNDNPTGQSRTHRISSKRWWNKDTLSAQSLSSHSDILLKARKNGLNQDVDVASTVSDPGYSGSEHMDSPYTAHNGDEKFSDFESYRKSQIYNSNSSSDKKTSAKKGNFLKKISRSLKKSDAKALEMYEENATLNPLTQQNANDLNF